MCVAGELTGELTWKKWGLKGPHGFSGRLTQEGLEGCRFRNPIPFFGVSQRPEDELRLPWLPDGDDQCSGWSWADAAPSAKPQAGEQAEWGFFGPILLVFVSPALSDIWQCVEATWHHQQSSCCRLDKFPQSRGMHEDQLSWCAPSGQHTCCPPVTAGIWVIGCRECGCGSMRPTMQKIQVYLDPGSRFLLHVLLSNFWRNEGALPLTLYPVFLTIIYG